MLKEDCVFCNIIQKQTQAKIVFEDELVIAFLDIDPISEGHTLVIPKNHYDDFLDVDEETLKHVITIAQIVAKKIFIGLKPDGLNVVQNNKEAAGQVIFHYHMHLIPRWSNDGMKMLNIQAAVDKDLFSIMDQTLEKIKDA